MVCAHYVLSTTANRTHGSEPPPLRESINPPRTPFLLPMNVRARLRPSVVQHITRMHLTNYAINRGSENFVPPEGGAARARDRLPPSPPSTADASSTASRTESGANTEGGGSKKTIEDGARASAYDNCSAEEEVRAFASCRFCADDRYPERWGGGRTFVIFLYAWSTTVPMTAILDAASTFLGVVGKGDCYIDIQRPRTVANFWY